VLEQRGINCVLDVGAHEGGFGKLLRGLGFRDLIVSFEPVQSAFEVLEEAAASNRPWTAHRLALGDADGETEINVPPANELSSLSAPTEYARSEFGDPLEVERTEPIPIRRLDTLFRDWSFPGDPRFLLKIDVQGAEWDVLSGAADTLGRVEVVQVEVGVKPLYEGARPWREVMQRLEEAGFELSGVVPVTRDGQLRIVEMDCILVKTVDSQAPRSGYS
jgi:FkbM family methyltransferase